MIMLCMAKFQENYRFSPSVTQKPYNERRQFSRRMENLIMIQNVYTKFRPILGGQLQTFVIDLE